jgi:hypothetical protein
MKKLLLLFPILSLCIAAHAQVNGEYYQGRYYDTNGQKHEGLIRYDFDYKKQIKFKVREYERVKILSIDQIKGFVIETDSFFVLKKFYREDNKGREQYVEAHFVEMIEPGPLTLVIHYNTYGYGNYTFPGPPNFPHRIISYYEAIKLVLLESFILVDAAGSATLVKKEPEQFKLSMTAFFKAYPEIVEKIEKGEYKWEDMPEIVRLYNQQASSRRN